MPVPVEGRAADFIVAARWFWPVLAILLVALSLARFDRIVPLEADARLFFSEDNPDRIALDDFETTFSRIDNILFVVEARNGEIFDPAVLKPIGEITEQGWLLPFARRVDSITNFPYTYADGDDLIVRDLIEDPTAVTPEEAARAKELALERVELVNRFIAPASDVSLIQVQITLPEKDQAAKVPMVAAAAQELRKKIEDAYPNIDIRVSGSSIMANQFVVSGVADGRNLMAPMFLVVLVIVWLATRSLFGTLSLMLVIVCASVGGLGFLGWMDVQMNSVTVLSPLYIMVLAVAASVHMLSAIRQHMPDTPDRTEWVRKALAEHISPIVITGVTTAIGFFCLNFSISPPLRQLGNVVGVGILASTLYTLTLLPSLTILLPVGRRTKSPALGMAMAGVAEFVIAHRKLLLLTTGILVIGMASGIMKLTLDNDIIRYFDDRYEFRRDADFIERRLTGLSSFDFPLRSGESRGVNNPDFLAEVADFTAWLRAQPEVTYVSSLTDTIARLNMNLNGDDPTHYRLPDTGEDVGQLLLLYELSLGYGMDLTDRIDLDHEILRVTAFMPDVSTARMRDLTLRAGQWLKQNAPLLQRYWAERYPDVEFMTPTGPTHVFNLISVRDTRSMLKGTLLALVLISGILILVLRDFRLGLISLIPNLIPSVMAFGLWGYGVGVVTLAVSVVAAATLGIVVDDTVHMLLRYSRARQSGVSAEDAVRYTFRSVGMAVIVTTVSLVAGFTILAQSGFAVNGDMAKLTAITIVLALLADFFLLPPLLIWWDTRKGAGAKRAKAGTVLGAALAVILLFGSGAGVAYAETAEDKAMKIALEADRRDLGFGSIEVEGEMILRDKSGRQSRRGFRSMVLERPGTDVGDLSILVFRSPPDIRGVALLTHSNIEPKNDDQWLYLSTIKRVKRISSSNRSGKFVASEFSYEDLGSQEVGDFDRKWIRDEPCRTDTKRMCFVSEDYPKSRKSGYSKRVTWIDTTEYRTHFVEFYNRRGDLEKTLTLAGYRQYLDRYWRADSLNMVNVQSGKSTELVWKDYRFKTGLSPRDFTKQRLKSIALSR